MEIKNERYYGIKNGDSESKQIHNDIRLELENWN